MKIATITHIADGVRITMGDGVVHNYANVTYVAEALANAMHARSELEKKFASIRTAVQKDASSEELMSIIDGEVPF